ncbi:hypothetical protein AHAS_Ahas11G0224900 [Arachis hypogaea]
MSLLEVVKNASINSKPLNSPLDYPIVLNSNTIIPNLKPEQEDTAALCLVKPLSGWKISQADAELIDIGKKFFIQLKANLKSGNGLEKDEFISDLNSYLNSITKKIGISVAINPSMPNYTKFLIDKNIVEALIEHGVIKHSCDSDLVTSILMYFFSPSKDAYDSMITVKEAWENQEQLAIDGISDSNWNKKNLLVAKEASILLMVAYDGFSASKICLHYLLASSNINDVLLSSSFSKLNGKELINLIRYLSKWLNGAQNFDLNGANNLVRTIVISTLFHNFAQLTSKCTGSSKFEARHSYPFPDPTRNTTDKERQRESLIRDPREYTPAVVQ